MAGVLDVARCMTDATCLYASLFFGHWEGSPTYSTCYLHNSDCGDWQNNHHPSYSHFDRTAAEALACVPHAVEMGVKTVTPGDHAQLGGGHALVGATEMSFAGWVRVDEWTNTYNRIFDFGESGHPCVRLHRNGGNTLRFALNSWDVTDAPDFFDGFVGQHVFITVTLDASGQRTIYRNGEVVAQAAGTKLQDVTWPSEPQFTVGKNMWLADGDEGSRMTFGGGLKWWTGVIDSECILHEMSATRPGVSARLQGSTYAECGGTCTHGDSNSQSPDTTRP